MLSDGAKFPMITAQALQEHCQFVDLVYLGNDLHQGINEMTALHGHRDGEQIPHLGMLDEQVRVKKQWQLVTVHRDMGEAFPQSHNVQRSRLSSPSPPVQ